MNRLARLKQRRGMRVLLLWMVMPAVAVVGMRLVWGWQASSRLEAVKAEMKAKGVLIGMERPANHPLNKLEAMMPPRLTTVEEELIWGPGVQESVWKMKWTEADRKAVEAALVRFEPVLAQIHTLAVEPSMDVPPKDWAALGPHRQLVEVMEARARLAVDAGHTARALREAATAQQLAVLSNRGKTLLHGLVATAVSAKGAQFTETLLPLVKMSADDGSISEARKLLEVYLETGTRLKPTEWLEAEIALAESFLKDYRTVNRWWIRPLGHAGITDLMLAMEKELDGTRATNWPQAQRTLPPVPGSLEHSNLTRFAKWGRYETPSTLKVMDLHLRARADVAAAGILLAAKIFAAEKGHEPQSLADLVPAYLPSLPQDPFADGQPMRFRLDPDGVTVWSIGADGIDGGAVMRYHSSGEPERRYGYSGGTTAGQRDIIYGAAWHSRPAASAPAAVPASAP